MRWTKAEIVLSYYVALYEYDSGSPDVCALGDVYRAAKKILPVGCMKRIEDEGILAFEEEFEDI